MRKERVKELASLILLAALISLTAHEAFHVITARVSGGKDIQVIIHPFLEKGDADRRTLVETRWTGGSDNWGESDEVVAWLLTAGVFAFTIWYLLRKPKVSAPLTIP